MMTVPLISEPAQTLSFIAANQSCAISLYSLQTPGDILNSSTTTLLTGYPALYMDLSVGGVSIYECRLCRNLIPLLLGSEYFGFVGNFVFVDTLSNTDPIYTGLGSQYQLVYLEASDLG